MKFRVQVYTEVEPIENKTIRFELALEFDESTIYNFVLQHPEVCSKAFELMRAIQRDAEKKNAEKAVM